MLTDLLEQEFKLNFDVRGYVLIRGSITVYSILLDAVYPNISDK